MKKRNFKVFCTIIAIFMILLIMSSTVVVATEENIIGTDYLYKSSDVSYINISDDTNMSEYQQDTYETTIFANSNTSNVNSDIYPSDTSQNVNGISPANAAYEAIVLDWSPSEDKINMSFYSTKSIPVSVSGTCQNLSILRSFSFTLQPGTNNSYETIPD